MDLSKSENFLESFGRAFLAMTGIKNCGLYKEDIKKFLDSLKQEGFEIHSSCDEKCLKIITPNNASENLKIIDEDSNSILDYTYEYINQELKESGTFEIKKYFKSFLKSEDIFISVKIRIHDFNSCRALEKEAKKDQEKNKE